MSSDTTVAKLLRSIEDARRGKNYVEMDEEAKKLLSMLEHDHSPETWKTRSKISYELQMGAFQQVETLLEQTQTLAVRSIAEADKGGDVIGRLFAEMTFAGHILPASRKGAEAMKMLRRTQIEAEGLLAETSDETERNRLLRVIMNCYWHQILLAIEYNGSPSDISNWMSFLENNPVFAQYKDTTGAKVLADAQAFIDSKK